MARNPRRIASQLDELYSRLPRLDCQGVCADSCGPIPAGGAERERMERARGRRLEAPEIRTEIDGHIEACHECSMMDDGRCSVYDIRPMICRLWGMTELLPCPYGCIPEGGRLSVREGSAFLADAYAIAGWPPGWEPFAREEILAMEQNPKARRIILERFRPTVAGRRGSLKPSAIERGVPRVSPPLVTRNDRYGS
jgi:Fe-S-cluster containining protein